MNPYSPPQSTVLTAQIKEFKSLLRMAGMYLDCVLQQARTKFCTDPLVTNLYSLYLAQAKYLFQHHPAAF